MKLKLLLDANVFAARELFGDLGQLRIRQPEDIQRSDVAWADVLICRSRLKVNEALLGNTRLLFVGTPVTGVDHLDAGFLRERRIPYSHAPGCNALSVADYALASVCLWLLDKGLRPAEVSAGIVGCGHIGQAVLARLQRLGMPVQVSDPPLAQEGLRKLPFAPLERVLSANIVCLHTPLTRTGDWPTQNLIRSASLKRMPKNSLLLSCGRGGVIDERDLLQWLADTQGRAVVDVWRNEPEVNRQLVKAAWLATPHIAGYSLDGRREGSLRIREKLLQLLDIFKPLPPPIAAWKKPVSVRAEGEFGPASTFEEGLEFVAKVSGLQADSRLFKQSQDESARPAQAFEQARRNYRPRRNFARLTVYQAEGEAARLLSALGFVLSSEQGEHQAS